MNRLNLGNDLYIKGRIGWKGLSKDEYLENSEYKIINATALMDGYVDWNNCGFISKDRYEESEEIMLQENDILISKDGTLGKIGYVKNMDKKCSVASGIFVVRNTIPDKLDFDYLYHILKSHIFKDFIRRNKAEGSTINHLYQRDLVNFEIDLPSIEVQRKVANVLNLLDNKISNNNNTISELESMAKTLYDYWFLQYEFPNEEGKPYKSSGGKMVYNEELKREIPENWKCQTINDVVDMVQGYAFSNRDYSSKGIYKLYTIKNVQDGEIVSKVDNKIKKIPSNMSNECMLKPLDIIMSLTGNVGRVGLVYENNALLNQRVLKIKPKNNNILYTYLLFRDVNMKLKLEKISTGTSQKNLSPVDMGNLKCLVPDNQTLNKFQLNNRIIQTIVNLKMENEELINLRDYLLPLLMNGQVSFKN